MCDHGLMAAVNRTISLKTPAEGKMGVTAILRQS
jgi:hypothetical protein